MKISKSLFKNLSRCSNFPSLYDMYTFKNLHHVKNVKGVELDKTSNLVKLIPDNVFPEEETEISEIFKLMFDEDTGDDLTELPNAQMEAYKEIFTEVERLAGEYIASKFPGKHIYDVDTKKQKRFSFTDKGNDYYCYIDIYNEDEDKIRIFEVKSTTSNKFSKLGPKIKNMQATKKSEQYDSIFIKRHDEVLHLKEEITDLYDRNKKYQNNKAKLFDRYGSEGVGRYVFDIAVQRYFVEQSLIQNNEAEKLDKIEYYLVVLNSDYVFNGEYINGVPNYKNDRNNNPLFIILDLTSVTKEWQDDIRIIKEKIEDDLEELAISAQCFGPHCEYKKTTECKFRPVCFEPFMKKGSILEYMKNHYAFKDYAGKTLSIYDLMNDAYYKIDDIPEDYLSKHYNLVQYTCYVNNRIYRQTDKIKLVLDTLEYPLYHLDFESYASPLPRYDMEKPYSQSVFQFSIHIEREKGKCDKDLDHIEFLAEDHKDHRLELVEKMIQTIDLSKGGTVIVYKESFEKTRIKELAKVFPQYKKELEEINEHIFDLYYVLRGNATLFGPLLEPNGSEEAKQINYYHNDMAGSYSIKKILPLFTKLSYQDLDVKNGTEAVWVYGMLPTLTEDEYKEKYLALKEYCKQDTWAMVEILWGLYKLE